VASPQAARRSSGAWLHPYGARRRLPPGERTGARTVGKSLSIRIRLLAALAYVLLLAIVALGVPLAINLRARVSAEVRTQAQAQADLVAATAADLLDRSRRHALQALADNAAMLVKGRVLIVDRNAVALVDSAQTPQLGVSYESRPEIEKALDGHPVQVERSSQTLGQQILATAVPILRDGRAIGAVRVTQSVASLHSAINRALAELALIALIVLALGLLAGALIAAQVGRPLKRLEAVARRVAGGDLAARATVEGSSEQRSLAASFNEMTTRIVRLLGAQRQFVADASHQLRTPLTGLRLRLEEAKAVSDGRAGSDLDAAIAEVDRLSHTIEELLMLSRAGERHTAGSPIDLDDLADDAVERWRPSALAAGLGIERRTNGRGDPAWAARPDAERALDTLLENAVHYSAPATTITVTTGPGRIEVRDRGPGFGDDELGAVFERFRRGRAGRAGPPGSGLGLAIARELAREWGGDVTVANRDGGGAVATLSLPAASAEQTPSQPDFART
jgi:two-component system, OmpR family, sensor kinase